MMDTIVYPNIEQQAYNNGYADCLRHTALAAESKENRLAIRARAERVRKYGLSEEKGLRRMKDE